MKQRIKEHNLDESAYAWYLELSKQGAVPHSGFGLGLERTVAWFSGQSISVNLFHSHVC